MNIQQAVFAFDIDTLAQHRTEVLVFHPHGDQTFEAFAEPYTQKVIAGHSPAQRIKKYPGFRVSHEMPFYLDYKLGEGQDPLHLVDGFCYLQVQEKDDGEIVLWADIELSEDFMPFKGFIGRALYWAWNLRVTDDLIPGTMLKYANIDRTVFGGQEQGVDDPLIPVKYISGDETYAVVRPILRGVPSRKVIRMKKSFLFD